MKGPVLTMLVERPGIDGIDLARQTVRRRGMVTAVNIGTRCYWRFISAPGGAADRAH